MPPHRQRAASIGTILLDGETDYLGEQPVGAQATGQTIDVGVQDRTKEFTSAVKHLLAITTYQKA